jgi:hypothetical protein
LPFDNYRSRNQKPCPTHNLIPLPAVEPGALTPAEIDATMAFAQAEKLAATHKAYSSDWADFAAWCHARGASPLPAHPGLVAAYLSDLAQAGRKASTVGRRAAAIAHRHKLAGLEPPTNAEEVRAVLRGIRRAIGTAPDRKSPATGTPEVRGRLRLQLHLSRPKHLRCCTFTTGWCGFCA